MTPPLSAHLSTLFTEHPPEHRPRAAAAAGFTMVESWWPPLEPPHRWAEMVLEAGLTAAAVNADGGDLARGDRGYCNRPERREDVLQAVESAARVVTAAGGRFVNLLVGRVHDEAPIERQLQTAADTVAAAADVAAGLGAALVIEHLNPVDVAAPLLPTPDAAARFVSGIGHPAVRVLFDAYHAAAAGLDPSAEFRTIAPLVGHVQYADHPGRGAPGSGRVSLPDLLATLAATGYDGAVGMEFLPDGPTAAAVAKLPGMA